MTASETDSKFDEMERDKLQAMISAVEAALAGSTPASRGVLERALHESRSRVGFLEKKIHDSHAEHEAQARVEASVAMEMAERETNLNATEKQTFAGFLRKDFFTKRDFGSLESFYAKTWDRLSESGKDEMSHRIWKGIRRDEYKFTDLPKTVQEKEMERAYSRLRGSAIGSADESRIPANDREDFFRAYEAGKREEAAKVLERESFKQTMFRHSEFKEIKQTRVEVRRDADGNMVGADVEANSPKRTAKEKSEWGEQTTAEIGRLNLGSVKLAEAPQQILSSDVPNAKGLKPGAEKSLG